MELLRCINLIRDYPGKRAVDGVSFAVNKGEIVGLLGPNGAGKSTSFRMACGLVAPTEGRVLLKGTDVTHWPMYQRARHGLGYLPQDKSIFARLTTEENIIAVLEFHGLSRRDCRARAHALLEEFNLGDRHRQLAGSLSGGEARRLEIARALACDPEILMLDEPFTGIDPKTLHDIQDIMRKLTQRGIAILLTDHREREMLTIADRSYIICDGKVLVSGNAETVLSNQDAISRYFGRRFDANSIIDGRNGFRNSA